MEEGRTDRRHSRSYGWRSYCDRDWRGGNGRRGRRLWCTHWPFGSETVLRSEELGDKLRLLDTADAKAILRPLVPLCLNNRVKLLLAQFLQSPEGN